jgi:hypothetical protein
MKWKVADWIHELRISKKWPHLVKTIMKLSITKDVTRSSTEKLLTSKGKLSSMKMGCSYIFSIDVCCINSTKMKNVHDRWIHGPMNAKENAITNLIVFFSFRQVRYQTKCQLIADTPTEIQK